MAKNIRMGGINEYINQVKGVVTVPTTNVGNKVPSSGTPVLIGSVPGVAHRDVDTDGLTTVVTHCMAELAVKGVVAGGGNGAINLNDVLYMQTNGDLNKNSSGTNAVKFGIAWASSFNEATGFWDRSTTQLVASGATTTIIVWVGKLV